MKLYKSLFLSFNLCLICFICVLVISCQNNVNKNGPANSQSVFPVDTNVGSANIGSGHLASETMEVKTFQVKDSTGNLQGWGYDIYSKGKKTIHQPIIPAIPGNWPFKSESDALKTGLFALSKMQKEGSLPTLSLFELDSLGVTK